MSKIDSITSNLPLASTRVLNDGLLNIPKKNVLSTAIVEALGARLEEKCYLAHLASTTSFEEYSKLACVSTSVRECLDYFTELTSENAGRLEVVCQLVNVYVYQSLAEHLNLSQKKASRGSFELSLFWKFERMTNQKELRENTLDRMHEILCDSPSSDFFFRILWDGFSELQANWVQSFFCEKSLRKRKAFNDGRIMDVKSEVQRFVGWGIKSTFEKKRDLANDGCKVSTEMVALLEKMRVFKADVEGCLEYISECYNFSEQILNKGGLTLVHREMFEWASTVIKRIAQRFNKSAIARDGKNAVKKAWATMRKDPFLLTLFLDGTKKITTSAPDENTVRTLHEELLLKIFHAQVGVELKDFESAKLKKKANSKVAFRPMLKVAAQHKPEARKEAPAKKSVAKKAAPAKTVAAKKSVAKNT
jgi:hypothetical protein